MRRSSELDALWDHLYALCDCASHGSTLISHVQRGYNQAFHPAATNSQCIEQWCNALTEGEQARFTAVAGELLTSLRRVAHEP